MKIGAMFPTNDLSADPAAIRDFAQGIEGMGFDYLITTDHVLQVDPKGDPNIFAPYTVEDAFHEPFVLFGFLAACTQKIELGTAILILPQRQTALVAKQAAEADFLSGGRLRLGIGIGWQEMEFTALGENWSNRGKRSEEQIELMRALWTNRLVEYKGAYHEVPESGLNPLPVQRPIPIWIGGMADAVAERVGRIGDGWIPAGPPELLKPQLDIIHEAAEKAGRDPKSIGIEAITGLQSPAPGAPRITMDEAIAHSKNWKDAGASHFSFNTQGIGLESADDHLALLKDYKERIDAL